jgi:hypothetical protein
MITWFKKINSEKVYLFDKFILLLVIIILWMLGIQIVKDILLRIEGVVIIGVNGDMDTQLLIRKNSLT